jgi:hypothetical protein
MLIRVFCGHRSRLWSLAISNDLAHVFDTTLDLFFYSLLHASFPHQAVLLCGSQISPATCADQGRASPPDHYVTIAANSLTFHLNFFRDPRQRGSKRYEKPVSQPKSALVCAVKSNCARHFQNKNSHRETLCLASI